MNAEAAKTLQKQLRRTLTLVQAGNLGFISAKGSQLVGEVKQDQEEKHSPSGRDDGGFGVRVKVTAKELDP